VEVLLPDRVEAAHLLRVLVLALALQAHLPGRPTNRSPSEGISDIIRHIIRAPR
jgi:hypothetical protein